MTTQINVCTHSGQFHCDEVMATAMLQELFPNKLNVIRTRDAAVIQTHQNDPRSMVIDVGHIYDPSRDCYDHHQTSFTDTFTEKYDIPLSSCGLIYKHYGRQLIEHLLRVHFKDVICTPERLDDIYFRFYKHFVLSIDAGDNGVDYCDNKRYSPIILPSVVSSFNGANKDDHVAQLERFLEAVEYCRKTLITCAVSHIRHRLDYYSGVSVFQESLKENHQELTDLGILVLKQQIPIDQYLRENDHNQHFKFIVVPFPQIGQYKLWTVRKRGKRFETLKKLIPETEARELVGDDLVFVHKAGFTGAAKNLNAAVQVVRASAMKPSSGSDSERGSESKLFDFFQRFSWVIGAGLSGLAGVAVGINLKGSQSLSS